MRDIKGGEAMALLQIIESDTDKQPATWKSIFTQDLRNKDILVKIAKHINEELFMSLVEEIEIRGITKGKIEGILESLSWTAPDIVQKYEAEIRAAKSEQELDGIKKKIKAELAKR